MNDWGMFLQKANVYLMYNIVSKKGLFSFSIWNISNFQLRLRDRPTLPVRFLQRAADSSSERPASFDLPRSGGADKSSLNDKEQPAGQSAQTTPADCGPGDKLIWGRAAHPLIPLSVCGLVLLMFWGHTSLQWHNVGTRLSQERGGVNPWNVNCYVTMVSVRG